MVEHYSDIIMRVVIFFYGLWCGGLATTIFNRIPNEIPIGPSHKPRCNNCGYHISFKYFFPILGYFLSNGKCIKCGMKIPRIYLLIELMITCYIVLLSFTFDTFEENFIATSLYGAFLITMMFIIIKHKKFKLRLIWMLASFTIAHLGYSHNLPKAIDLFTIGVLSYGSLFFVKKIIKLEAEEFKACMISLVPFGVLKNFVIALIAISIYLISKTRFKKNLQKIENDKFVFIVLALSLVATFFR